MPIDADVILKILVCTRNLEDFWVWQPERKGLFSVSSTYKLIIKTKTQREDWLEGTSGAFDSTRHEKSMDIYLEFFGSFKGQGVLFLRVYFTSKRSSLSCGD
jgi:hypothetical protein